MRHSPEDISGVYTATCTIGGGDASVEVDQTYRDGEPDGAVVTYKGVDVTDIMTSELWDSIDKQFQKNWKAIMEANRDCP